MTTLELIEKYGIGPTCLNDAYALGMMHGLDVLEHAVEFAEEKARVDAIEEFRTKINQYLNESTDFADFVVTDCAIDCVLNEMKGEQLKEKNND